MLCLEEVVLELGHDGNGTNAASIEAEKEATYRGEDGRPDVVWNVENRARSEGKLDTGQGAPRERRKAEAMVVFVLLLSLDVVCLIFLQLRLLRLYDVVRIDDRDGGAARNSLYLHGKYKKETCSSTDMVSSRRSLYGTRLSGEVWAINVDHDEQMTVETS